MTTGDEWASLYRSCHAIGLRLRLGIVTPPVPPGEKHHPPSRLGEAAIYHGPTIIRAVDVEHYHGSLDGAALALRGELLAWLRETGMGGAA